MLSCAAALKCHYKIVRNNDGASNRWKCYVFTIEFSLVSLSPGVISWTLGSVNWQPNGSPGTFRNTYLSKRARQKRHKALHLRLTFSEQQQQQYRGKIA